MVIVVHMLPCITPAVVLNSYLTFCCLLDRAILAVTVMVNKHTGNMNM